MWHAPQQSGVSVRQLSHGRRRFCPSLETSTTNKMYKHLMTDRHTHRHTVRHIHTIRYDRRVCSVKSSTCSQKKYKKEETKTNKCHCPLSSVQVQDPWRQSGRSQKDYGGKDLWKRWVLSLEWKVEAVIGDESEGGDCDEVICAGWGEPGGEWTEWGWRNEEGSRHIDRHSAHLIQWLSVVS